MRFALFFFSSDAGTRDNPYELMLEAAKFADRHGFAAVWTPERHFDRFGGAFANPALTSAALAMVTERLQLRSGSLISPLHDVIRIAEEWSMVDQLSRGRAAISFGSGWNANDFVFFPERYVRRQEVMLEQIHQLRRLWRGERCTRQTPTGPAELELFPKPRQRELPIWLTTSGSAETYRSAARLGANVLTHMIMQDRTQLAEHIRLYRNERTQAGLPPAGGIVSLMLHTFIGHSDETVRRIVRPSFREYLRSAVKLEVAAAQRAGTVSGGLRMAGDEIPPDLVEELLDMTFDRYYEQASCMGTIDTAARQVNALAAAGVDEIACLIDFGLTPSTVLEGLDSLRQLKERFDPT
ncbi:LLM class flavin-dependent oxidoreductase [Nannocystis sp. ILAH1]|uniref:MupA/Atu3671 family FMN-dependent luciferase-like monooxygenase n=1 Tax=unclassified Nannocystis TaxID=2627009 RepID=UPI00226F5A5B|nr:MULTISPECIES: MupA/Atu3671 family FMN-dependent luciferase-like monooxygenase [unclassified Nannocystis]MCY0989532.1 LLM class flavin-dependent oxidoreductase [Nannocystis sp. ILAH1]MCY1064848.1 LLM class flavin-dependent oxidoreductase [Nannocystis sp. RBIL2]